MGSYRSRHLISKILYLSWKTSQLLILTLFFHALAVNCSDVLSETSSLIAPNKAGSDAAGFTSGWISGVQLQMIPMSRRTCLISLQEIVSTSCSKYPACGCKLSRRLIRNTQFSFIMNVSASYCLEMQNSGLTWKLSRHQLWDLNLIFLCIGCKLSQRLVKIIKFYCPKQGWKLSWYSWWFGGYLVPTSRSTCPVFVCN